MISMVEITRPGVFGWNSMVVETDFPRTRHTFLIGFVTTKAGSWLFTSIIRAPPKGSNGTLIFKMNDGVFPKGTVPKLKDLGDTVGLKTLEQPCAFELDEYENAASNSKSRE